MMRHLVMAGIVALLAGCGGFRSTHVKTETSDAEVTLSGTSEPQSTLSQEEISRRGYVALREAVPSVQWKTEPFSVKETQVRWVLTFVPAERGKGPLSYIVWVDKASGKARPVGSR